MGKEIIICVAPTSGNTDEPQNPKHPDEISKDVVASYEQGARVVHIHSRDTNGNLTTNMSFFKNTARKIKSDCDIMIEASTGGLSSFTAEERIMPVDDPHAELGSLNIGSLNFGDEVYINSLPDVRMWIERMKSKHVKPSLEVFDTGHLETALSLIKAGKLTPPCNFSFIFGVKWGMPYDKKLLQYLVARLPPESRWGGIFIGSNDFSAHIEAAKMGASVVRVGFEDSRNYNGKYAHSNEELVKALTGTLVQHGFSIPDSATARKVMLN